MATFKPVGNDESLTFNVYSNDQLTPFIELLDEGNGQENYIQLSLEDLIFLTKELQEHKT
jgi:hypothetical protein